MEHSLPYQVAVIGASLIGAAGFVLAVQAWRKFRGTPFGQALSMLPVFMLIIALYHPVLMIFPAYLDVALLVEATGFLLLVIFVGLMIRIHRRMSPAGGRR